MGIILRLLGTPQILAVLLIINGIGTIYGYWWYKVQLVETPPVFLPFVPDSPTASLFFCGVLVLFLFRKHSGLLEALAAVTLLKYGVWAVAMNVAQGGFGDALQWEHYMLIVSHGAMAVQAFLFMPYYRIKKWHLAAAAVWTVHNDIIDYVYGMYPWVAPVLSDKIEHIGYFTFWLSVLSVTAVFAFSVKRRHFLTL
ncbi:lipoprotein heptaprenylglyceryl N-acetyltransferase LhaT [Salibacterium sp. K-3]